MLFQLTEVSIIKMGKEMKKIENIQIIFLFLGPFLALFLLLTLGSFSSMESLGPGPFLGELGTIFFFPVFWSPSLVTRGREKLHRFQASLSFRTQL